MVIKSSLKSSDLKPIFAALKRANDAFGKARPGDSGERQPVHVVYGGAHLFKRDSASRLCALALNS